MAGRESTVRFAFAKVEEPAASGSSQGDSPIFPAELVEKWRRQQRAIRTGKFRIRQYSVGGRKLIPRAALDALLNEGDLGKILNFIATIRARFPDLVGLGDDFS